MRWRTELCLDPAACEAYSSPSDSLAAIDNRTHRKSKAFLYTVSQKKTSPTFLAITRESIDGFL